jgi:hypothetical protein
MKKIILAGLLAISFNAHSAIKCESDGRGGMCCWDTTKSIFKPITC